MGNAILRPPQDKPHGSCLSCIHVREGSITHYKSGLIRLFSEKKGVRDNSAPYRHVQKGCWLWERAPGTDDEESWLGRN